MTSAAVSARPVSAPRSRKASDDGRGLLRLCVVLLILGQRLALPLGGDRQLPLTIVGMLAISGYGLARGRLVTDRRQAVLLGASLVVLSAVTCLAAVRDLDPSVLSLLLLTLIYLPAALVPRDPGGAPAALRFFVDLMLLLSAAAVLLFLLQYAGVPYRDYVLDVVPAQFVQDGFNTSYPLAYDSEIYRSNGVVFLEASVFSLFLGLALVVSLHLAHRRTLAAIFLLAIPCTLSGNGVVFVLACLPWLLASRDARRRLAPLAVPVVLVAVALVLSPLGGLLAGRATELSSDDSSARLRMVEPYEALVPAWSSGPESVVLGNGAGSVTDYFRSTGVSAEGSRAAFVPAVPKLLYEYGWLGGVPMLVFLLRTFLSRARSLPWLPGILVCYFVVNASLQQATLAATAFVFLWWFGPGPAGSSAREVDL
jgi:hypothetical protein